MPDLCFPRTLYPWNRNSRPVRLRSVWMRSAAVCSGMQSVRQKRAAAEEKTGDEKSQRESRMAKEQLRKVLDYMAVKIAKADNTDCCITQLIRQLNRESASSHLVREIYVEALRKLAESKKKTGGSKA